MQFAICVVTFIVTVVPWCVCVCECVFVCECHLFQECTVRAAMNGQMAGPMKAFVTIYPVVQAVGHFAKTHGGSNKKNHFVLDQIAIAHPSPIMRGLSS